MLPLFAGLLESAVVVLFVPGRAIRISTPEFARGRRELFFIDSDRTVPVIATLFVYHLEMTYGYGNRYSNPLNFRKVLRDMHIGNRIKGDRIPDAYQPI